MFGPVSNKNNTMGNTITLNLSDVDANVGDVRAAFKMLTFNWVPQCNLQGWLDKC